MTSDSNRHAQRGDAKQAPSERCQSGPKGIAQMTSPNLQRGDRVEELKPCRACNSGVRIERFEGSHIEGVMTIYICANSTKFGGDCPDPHAYLNVNAWNTLQSPEAVTDETVIEALKQASWDLRYAKREFGRSGDKQSARMMEVAQKAADAALSKVSPLIQDRVENLPNLQARSSVEGDGVSLPLTKET